MCLSPSSVPWRQSLRARSVPLTPRRRASVSAPGTGAGPNAGLASSPFPPWFLLAARLGDRL
eukprot:11177922-Lingulodinium_polyedra.AAC.1